MIKVSSFRQEVVHEKKKQFTLNTVLPVFVLVCVLWFFFWWDANSSFKFYKLGVYPQTLHGLLGVVFAPLVHAGLNHLTNNSIPLLILGTGLQYFYPKVAWRVVAYSWLGSGVLVWLFARESYHIGASGLVYALVGFMLLSGMLRKQPNLTAISLLVVFLYGGLVWGVLPVDDTVSHEAHLSGAAIGFLLAYLYKNKDVGERKKYSWDVEVEEETEHLPNEEKRDVQKHEWERLYGEQNEIKYDYIPNKHLNKRDE